MNEMTQIMTWSDVVKTHPDLAGLKEQIITARKHHLAVKGKKPSMARVWELEFKDELNRTVTPFTPEHDAASTELRACWFNGKDEQR